MTMDLQELEEIQALRDADTLHMLPPEALVASIKYLAEKVLEPAAIESVAELEAEVSRLWGPTMFDWTLGRCRHNEAEVWFWMCGTAEKRRSWLHEGDAPTLAAALRAMIAVRGSTEEA